MDISFWQFPLSVILSLFYTVGVYFLWKYLPHRAFRSFLTGRIICIISLVVTVVMSVIGGIWGFPIHRNPVLWAASLMMLLSLEFDILNGFKRKGNIARTVCHTGMFLILFGAFWGAPDIIDSQIVISSESKENTAFANDGRFVSLPFTISLVEFRTDYYNDGISPKQFSSILDIDGRRCKTSVNHPYRYKGYWIYQSDYDHDRGSYSVLKLVRDRWLPFVYAGMLLLAAGAFLRLKGDWDSRYLIVAIAVISVLFTVLSIARINFGTLMPALRSWWFIPHIVLYMIAYSSLALSCLFGILNIAGFRPERTWTVSLRLFNTASSLLLLGMICGAVWAKSVWGDWWTWDAKECWAAVTWLFTICGTHLPAGMHNRNAAVLVCILLSFLAMQIAWYGVDYLPAAQLSIHTYK